MKIIVYLNITLCANNYFVLENTYMSSTLPITPPETPHTSISVSSELKSKVPTPSQPINSAHFKRNLHPELAKVVGNN